MKPVQKLGDHQNAGNLHHERDVHVREATDPTLRVFCFCWLKF